MVEQLTNPSNKQSSGRLTALCLVGVVICGGAYFARDWITHAESAEPKLELAGTSAAALIIDNSWGRTCRVATGTAIEYHSTGSTEGINQLIAGKQPIILSHSPLSEEQRAKAKTAQGEVVHIPMILCAVVPAYNVAELKDKPPLRFTGETLAGIFLGKIDRWNHPALVAINPDADLPDKPIAVIHREDSSGTTSIFTDYLAKASPEWKVKVGPGKGKVAFPVGVGKVRSRGVSEHLLETDGGITYLDLVHVDIMAETSGVRYGAVENRDKSGFIHAEAENITASVKNSAANIGEDLTFSLTYQPGANSYPICGGIWAIAYQKLPTEDHRKVTEFLEWALKHGQAYGPDLSYAPLPPELVERARERVKSIAAKAS